MYCNNKSDKLIIFSAPSGAGKTTIVKHVLSQIKDIEFSISACTREKRKGEIDGEDYYFISKKEFQNHIKNDDFVEWEEVYEDNFYGTLKSEVDRIWKKGNAVIFDIDVEGGINIKKYYKDKALSIFVNSPSVEELEKRLIGRNTETSDKISMRIAKAKSEISKKIYFDKVVINDDLQTAKDESLILIRDFLEN